MHPPLDRPHPDCQTEVDDLHLCHNTNSKFRFWACNDIKASLDRCFRAEKERMLKEMNKGIEERRAEEEAQAAISTGKNVTFQQYLKTDKAYQQELDRIAKGENKSWFG